MARKSTNGNSLATDDTENGDNANSVILDGNDSTTVTIDSGAIEQDSAINPGDIISGEPEPDSGSSGKRKRGRPRSTRNGATKTERKETSNDLSGVLMSIHLMLASWTSVEELTIDNDEARRLSDAVLKVNDLYGGFIIPEKYLAWASLAMCCGGIYGPRLAAYKLRMTNEKKKQPVTIDAVPIR